MPITLQVSQVRTALYQAAGGAESAGGGTPTTPLLGRLFHEIFAALTSKAAQPQLMALFHLANPSAEAWREALLKHTYQHLAGPRLRRYQSELHQTAEQALTFWDALQAMCNWLADTFFEARARGLFHEALTAITVTEEELRWELREPDWTDTVILTGRADAVWRIPETNRWCVIELKTGRTAPAADLAQVCLYHQMLSASGWPGNGDLALISFEPDKQEKLLPAESLKEQQQCLRALIGRLAGVLPTDSNTQPLPSPAPDAYQERGRELVQAYGEYGAEIKLGQPLIGPTFLRFPLELGRRVALAHVMKQTTNVQSRLALSHLPRVSFEEGRIAIDLQRPDRQTVCFSEVLPQLPVRDELFGNAKAPIGVDLNGRLRLADFSEPDNAHMLVGGTTGSGKSEWMRSALAGLLFTNTPATLRVALADPKLTAFQFLENSPFLLDKVACDEAQVIQILQGLVAEMEARYAQMNAHKVKTLSELVQAQGKPIPRIFFLCDEYAYLMTGETSTRKRLEDLIRKLGYKARAAGIHMILATQQPSRQVVTGTIKTNLNARVGLLLNSEIESKMMLDDAEAKTLLGKGDLLYKCVGEPVRLQAPFLSEAETTRFFPATLPKENTA